MERLTLGLLTMLLLSCSSSQSVVLHVGNHAFAVPKRQLMRKQIFWMSFEEDGMSFVTNPDSKLPDQILVGLRTVRDICPDGLTAGSNPSAYLCSKKSIIYPSPDPIPTGKLQKSMGDMGKAVWSYSLRDASGDRVIASCSEGSPGDRKGGLCFGIAFYRDLMFRIYVREIDLPRMPILVTTAQATLSKWEADASNS